MTEPIRYRMHTFRDSRIHVARVDLARCEFRPYVARESFPFRLNRPATEAHEAGAAVMVAGGFNIVRYHNLGVTDQPQHLLVLDREIWTTGIGAGGYGFLIGDDAVTTQKNRVSVKLWQRGGTSTEVEHINRGHDGKVVAFTMRGGTNEMAGYKVTDYGYGTTRVQEPITDRHYLRLTQVDEWTVSDKGSQVRGMRVAPFDPFDSYVPLTFGEVIIESRWKLDLEPEVLWVQRIGGPNVRHVLSGWPEMVHDGENMVKYLEMDPQAPRGPDNWFVRTNPRTALGASNDGRTAFLIAVEGRLPNQYRPDAEPSRGLRLKALGEFARRALGVTHLINTDGGGSAFMQLYDNMKAPGCYNASGSLEGQRPAHWCPAVFVKEA